MPETQDSYHLPPIEWRIRDAQGLRAAYVNSGMTLTNDQKLEGFVGLDEKGRTVVYTMRPKTVDDSVACTLGHEVMHVALGNYHK